MLPYALSGALHVALAVAFFLAAWGYGQQLVRVLALPYGGTILVALGVGTGLLGYVAFALGMVGWLTPAALMVVLLVGVVLALYSLRGVVRRRARDGAAGAASSGAGAPGGDTGVANSGAPGVLACDAGDHARTRVASHAGIAARWRRFVRPAGHGFAWWTGVVALAAAGLALLGALLPEIEYDALWYHLAFPVQYLAAGRLLDLPCNHMSPTPQHVELLYTYGLLFGDSRGPKLIHWGFGLLAGAWAAWLTARWVGQRWAVPAAALFLTAPTVLWEMTTAYNDLPLAFYATGAVALLLEWRRARAPAKADSSAAAHSSAEAHSSAIAHSSAEADSSADPVARSASGPGFAFGRASGRRLLVYAAILLGFGLAGKHLGWFFVAPLALGVALVGVEAESRSLWRRLADAALLVVVAVGVALPWYVRSWHYTGNPLFPMFYGVLARLGLPLQRWDAQAASGWAAAMARYGHGRSLHDFLLLPWRATWEGVRFGGSLGPVWLLSLPLVLLFWRRMGKEMRLLTMLGVVYVVLWCTPFSSFQVRYLVPVLPVLAVIVATVLAGALALLRRVGWQWAARILAAGTIAALAMNLPIFYPLNDARQGWIPSTFHEITPTAVRTVLGDFDVQRYLRHRLESYAAASFVASHAPPSARVVWFGEAADFYTGGRAVMDFSACVAAGTWEAAPGEEEQAYRALVRAGVSYILWDKTRHELPPNRFAIMSPLFRARYDRLVYEDDAEQLYQLVPSTDAPHTDTQRVGQ